MLFAARLQDYSYRLNKLVSLTPAQFCKSDQHLQCCIRLGKMARARSLARPIAIEATDDLDCEAPPTGGADADADAEPHCEPPVPQRHVKRLAFGRLQLEPEYLLERLRDECAQLQLPCTFSEMVDSELMRLEVHQNDDKAGDLSVILHVMPDAEAGDYRISFTRLRGDTFKFHGLFRAMRERLADVIASSDDPTPRIAQTPKVALVH